MAKHIGNCLSSLGATDIGTDNLTEMPGAVRLSWAQVSYLKKLQPNLTVLASYNRTDRGGPHTYAKRWWSWFVRLEDLEGLILTAAIRARVAKVESFHA